MVAMGLALVPACNTELDMVGTLGQASNCPMDECGGNAAELITGLFTGELHLFQGQNTGQANHRGAKIAGFIAPGGATDYIMKVEHGQLSASNGATTLTGASLVGSKILVTNTDDSSVVELVIHNHGTVQSWTTPWFYVDRYVFKNWSPELEQWVPICTDAVDLVEDSAWSVLVSHELYHWGAKIVDKTGANADGWFNLACSGNGLYKMKMAGYDPDPTAASPFSSTWQQRQATLKMITADYCGTGTSFTETGTTVYWINQPSWSQNTPPPPSTTVEAHWTKDGAACLDTPRLGAGELSAIQTECENAGKTLPPPCNGYVGPYTWHTEVP